MYKIIFFFCFCYCVISICFCEYVCVCKQYFSSFSFLCMFKKEQILYSSQFIGACNFLFRLFFVWVCMCVFVYKKKEEIVVILLNLWLLMSIEHLFECHHHRDIDKNDIVSRFTTHVYKRLKHVVRGENDNV